MPDDPLESLGRLAPSVDADAALRALGNARRRPRPVLTATAMSLTAGAIVVGIVLLRGGDEGQRVNTDLTSTETVRDGDIELIVSVPAGRLVVGERTAVDVTLRNLGDEAYVFHGLGTCQAFGVLASDSNAWSAPTSIEDRVTWDGESPLATHLQTANALPAPTLRDGWSVGARPIACAAALLLDSVAPGDERRWHASVDAVVGPTPPGQVSIEVSTADGARHMRAVLDIPIDDRTDRLASVDEAIAAFEADPRLGSYLDEARAELATSPELTQSWTTSLGWHFDAWELWLEATWDEDAPIRLRYDPVEGTVVDVRRVPHGVVPSDDPQAPDYPGGPPDYEIPLR